MATRWWVACPEYSVGPFPTREAAERRLTQIEGYGACHETHKVVEATERPYYWQPSQ